MDSVLLQLQDRIDANEHVESSAMVTKSKHEKYSDWGRSPDNPVRPQQVHLGAWAYVEQVQPTVQSEPVLKN